MFSFKLTHLFYVVRQTLSNFAAENPNVRQLRNSKPDLRQTHRGGACSRHQGIHLEEVRSLHTSPLIFKVLDLTKVPSAYALTAYHRFSLDDLMQFTCIHRPQKLYYCRLHTVIGICFWFGLQTIIIVFQRKNVQNLTHTSSKGFTPRTKKYYSFYDSHYPGRKKNPSLL